MSVDPRAAKYSGWSPYHYVLNNPILNIDPRGDTTRVYSLEGQLLETIEDSHPNEDHFMSQQTISLIEELGLNNGDANARGATYRELSSFFIGFNTRADLLGLSKEGDSDRAEAYAVGIISESREIRLVSESDKAEIVENWNRPGESCFNCRDATGVSFTLAIGEVIYNNYSNVILEAHSHGTYSVEALYEGKGKHPTHNNLKYLGAPTFVEDYLGSAVADKGNLNVGLIATPHGYTIFSLGTDRIRRNLGQSYSYQGAFQFNV